MKAFIYLQVFLLALSVSLASAQAEHGSLRGQVTDPSGAAITGADVVLTPASGTAIHATTNSRGEYNFRNLPPGKYMLNVVATGFTVYENDQVQIAGQPMLLNVPLSIAVAQQRVQVSDTAPTIDVNPSNNAGAITISGKELDALPDDPDELESDLQALAGPSAGPNGGQMYIDGFTAGQLPPKASIREIRINQNPFSAEYDKLGYGRIEIFTKPGTDKLHGQFMVNGNDSAFNSNNPFANGTEPAYHSIQFDGSVGGPLAKNASFFVNADRRNINDLNIINAQTIDPTTFAQENFIGSVPYPRTRTNLGPRIDWAPTKNNTLTARYQYYRDTETNDGIGQLTLESQGYNSTDEEHTVQISDTQVIGTNIVNETRFQFLREIDTQNPLSSLPTINVLGSFYTGGNNQGTLLNHENHYEMQNYTSIIHGNHTVKFGGRLRGVVQNESTTSGFNGTFIFSDIYNVQAAECALSANPPAVCSTANVLSAPTTPRQLAYTQGANQASVDYVDAGLYVQDDWKILPNFTLSEGLRFETQNGIHDHGDWAPRLGFAWGIGGRSGPPKFVLRGGFGIFYDRFETAQILQAELLNGVTQQDFVVKSPTCYPGLNQPLSFANSNCLTGATLVNSYVYQINPRLRAPYTLQSAVSLERQVTKSATVSATYLNSRGFDQFLSLSLNPTTVGGPNIYQYASEGNFNQNQLILNTNVRVGARFQLFGYYVLNYANSDVSGVSSFPSNSYDISQDYGRASFDARNRVFLGGSIALPYLFRLSPFMVVSSGSPFNILAPTDLNGDSIYNDRPAFATGATCGTATIYQTALGSFNGTPCPGQLPIPINYATGPSHVTLNMRLSKTFGFGPESKGPSGGPGPGGGHHHGPLFGGGPTMMSANSDRRYNLILSAGVRNIFNKVNLDNPSGILGSPYFNQSDGLEGGPFSTAAAVRRIDLQATFSF